MGFKANWFNVYDFTDKDYEVIKESASLKLVKFKHNDNINYVYVLFSLDEVLNAHPIAFILNYKLAIKLFETYYIIMEAY